MSSEVTPNSLVQGTDILPQPTLKPIEMEDDSSVQMSRRKRAPSSIVLPSRARIRSASTPQNMYNFTQAAPLNQFPVQSQFLTPFIYSFQSSLVTPRVSSAIPTQTPFFSNWTPPDSPANQMNRMRERRASMPLKVSTNPVNYPLLSGLLTPLSGTVSPNTPEVRENVCEIQHQETEGSILARATPVPFFAESSNAPKDEDTSTFFQQDTSCHKETEEVMGVVMTALGTL